MSLSTGEQNLHRREFIPFPYGTITTFPGSSLISLNHEQPTSSSGVINGNLSNDNLGTLKARQILINPIPDVSPNPYNELSHARCKPESNLSVTGSTSISKDLTVDGKLYLNKVSVEDAFKDLKCQIDVMQEKLDRVCVLFQYYAPEEQLYQNNSLKRQYRDINHLSEDPARLS